MTPQPRIVKKSLAISEQRCATIPASDAHAPWLIVLHGMAIIMAGLRKWLKLGATCDRCGRQF